MLYRGQCLIHRAEIMTLHGDWADADEEIQRARARLADPPGQHALGAVHYMSAELHRLQGRFPAAEDAYRLAGEHGRDPQPGLALLRLVQGRIDAAAAAIRRALCEVDDPVSRVRLLGPCVEILLAAADIDAAHAAAEELTGIAHRFDTQPYLRALAAQARGSARCSSPETIHPPP